MQARVEALAGVPAGSAPPPTSASFPPRAGGVLQCSSRPVAGAARGCGGAGGRASAARSRSPSAPSRAEHSDAGGFVVNEPARLVAAAAARAAGAGAGPEYGPRAAAGALRAALPSVGDREDWVRAAWTAALLGSCPASTASVQSGLRCWFAYAGAILGLRPGQALPPTAEGLVSWSLTFRCPGTFANYVAHVRLGCLLAGACVAVFGHPAVKRAKAAVAKRGLHMPCSPQFVRLPLLERLVAGAGAGPDGRMWSLLWLLSYAFLLRVPSEALPARAGDSGLPPSWQAGVFLSGEELCLRLRQRKNRRQGSLLTRKCWCARSPSTCPVHVVGRRLAGYRQGEHLFPGVTPARALGTLRSALHALGVSDADCFRTHDFRRGHAEARDPVRAVPDPWRGQAPRGSGYESLRLHPGGDSSRWGVEARCGALVRARHLCGRAPEVPCFPCILGHARAGA